MNPVHRHLDDDHRIWPMSMMAGILMLPYLGWVAFASVLNFTIWRLNG
jgi:tryptophan-rich sensory protein